MIRIGTPPVGVVMQSVFPLGGFTVCRLMFTSDSSGDATYDLPRPVQLAGGMAGEVDRVIAECRWTGSIGTYSFQLQRYPDFSDALDGLCATLTVNGDDNKVMFEDFAAGAVTFSQPILLSGPYRAVLDASASNVIAGTIDLYLRAPRG